MDNDIRQIKSAARDSMTKAEYEYPRETVQKEKRAITSQMSFNNESLTELERALSNLVDTLQIVLPGAEPTSAYATEDSLRMGSSQLYYEMCEQQQRIMNTTAIVRYLNGNIEL